MSRVIPDGVIMHFFQQLIEGTEHISRDLSKLSKDELKQIVKSESPELIVMLREIQTKVNDLRNEFKVFKKTIEVFC